MDVKRKFSYIQRKQAARCAVLDEQISKGRHLVEMMKGASTTEQIEKFNVKLNAMVAERDELLRVSYQERRACAKILLQCFCCCDLMAELADEFGDKQKEISHGMETNDNDFAAAMRQVGRDAEELVTQIDKADNYALAVYYAKMAEEATTSAKKAIAEVIDRWADTDKGKQLF